VNVFDIKQGVSINIFVKTGKKKSNVLGKVFHFDLYGKRELKYDFLLDNSIKTVAYKKVPNVAPNYFFVNKDFDEQNIYNEGFIINELYVNISTGYYTSCDELVIANSKKELEEQINNCSQNNLNFKSNLVQRTSYRPFDEKMIYFDPKLITRSRSKFIGNFLGKDNCILLSGKGTKAKDVNHFFISKIFSELKCAEYTTGSYMFPLYNYPSTNNQQTIHQTTERTPNLKPEIVKQIAEKLGLTFTTEKESTEDTFAPIDILDYIYAVLHSPTYREKYKEFLKIDFPRVPYPKDQNTFWQLVKLGGEIRQIHLLESPIVEKYITQYPIDGDNVVTKPKYKDSKVFINDTQYFANVPEVAWNFYIGGYKPAQKWLKDRKDRKLEFDDISHYQKIIVALTETDRLMKEIDTIKFE
jgi:predicted helicase